MTPDLQIKQLLVLQEHELKHLSVESLLRILPREKDALDDKILAERTALDEAKKALKQLEVRLNEIDMERGSIEQKIATYKTQQLQVKKNEEYTALEKEIAVSTDRVNQLEEDEICLMVQIEEEQAKFKRKQVCVEERVKEIEGEIAALDKRKATLEESLKKTLANIETAADQIDPKCLNIYAVVKNNVAHPPFLVPLDGHKCGGCHLRISNEVQRAVQQHSDEIHYCDQCGRIVY